MEDVEKDGSGKILSKELFISSCADDKKGTPSSALVVHEFWWLNPTLIFDFHAKGGYSV